MSMFRFLSCFIAGLALAVSACGNTPAPETAGDQAAAATEPAQTASADEPAEAAGDDSVTPMLWRVRADTGHSIYLFGTIHQGITVDQLSPAVLERLDEADIFVQELDLLNLDQASLQKAILLDDAAVYADVDAEMWQRVSDVLGVPPAQLQALEPWFVAMQLQLKLFPVTAPMDMQLAQRATAADKKVVALETLEEQLSAVSTVTSVDDVIWIVENLDAAKRAASALLEAYRAGDPEAMHEVAFSDIGRMREGDMAEVILYARNRNWVPKLEDLMTEGESFVAVGALHLAGPKSVIDLLQRKGYKVERIELPADEKAPLEERRAVQ